MGICWVQNSVLTVLTLEIQSIQSMAPADASGVSHLSKSLEQILEVAQPTMAVCEVSVTQAERGLRREYLADGICVEVKPNYDAVVQPT